MKRIDAHLHFSGDAYFHDIARRAGHRNSEGHLREQYRRHEMVHGVVMGNHPGPGPLEQPYPDFLSYCVGVRSPWLSPEREGETLRLLERHLRAPSCVGIKLYPGYEAFSVADPLCDGLYELAGKYKKPVAAHMGYTASGETSPFCHPDTMGRAAERWPDLQFVMCHMGNPWIKEAVEVMRDRPNIAADLSGILEGKAEDLDSLLRRMNGFSTLLRLHLERLGDYSRILYGTDWPLANIADYIGFVEDLVPQMHQDAVFYQNAKRIYQLNWI